MLPTMLLECLPGRGYAWCIHTAEHLCDGMVFPRPVKRWWCAGIIFFGILLGSIAEALTVCV